MEGITLDNFENIAKENQEEIMEEKLIKFDDETEMDTAVNEESGQRRILH